MYQNGLQYPDMPLKMQAWNWITILQLCPRKLSETAFTPQLQGAYRFFLRLLSIHKTQNTWYKVNSIFIGRKEKYKKMFFEAAA